MNIIVKQILVYEIKNNSKVDLNDILAIKIPRWAENCRIIKQDIEISSEFKEDDE